MATYELDGSHAMDEYGGFVDLPVPGGGTGYFRIGQIGERLTFVTPLGNAFLQKGMMVWNPQTDRWERQLTRKYGGVRTQGFYTPYALIRMNKMLGINTVGWGSTYNVMPIKFLGVGDTVTATGIGFPHVNNHGIAQPAVGIYVKDILRSGANDPATGLCNGGVKYAAWGLGYNAVRRAIVDFGDPGYGPTAGSSSTGTRIKVMVDKRKGEFETGFPVTFDAATIPWIMSHSGDDADPLFGHKGGLAVHPGWVCCVTSPYQYFQGTQSAPGTVYDGIGDHPEPQVYGKILARDWLRNKYTTIDNLNAAWGGGANYTTWDSSDTTDPMRGWQLGTGTGFMDEDGVDHPWIKVSPAYGVWGLHYMCGLFPLLPAIKADLDAILEHVVEILHRQYYDVLKENWPNHLLMSPSALKHDLGFWKPSALRAMGRVWDYMQFDYNPNLSDVQGYLNTGGLLPALEAGDTSASLARTYNICGKPIVAWQSAPCFPDSAAQRLADSPTRYTPGAPPSTWKGEWGGDPRMRPTMEGKGYEYMRHLDHMFSATGSDGKKFWLGFDNWNPIDQHGEGLNWGFLTEQDNAYDGQQTDTFGQLTSPARRDIGLNNRHMITDETGHPISRWTAGPDNVLHVRQRHGDSIRLIRAATRNAEFRWLEQAGAPVPPEPPVTVRIMRHGGSTRPGGRIYP